MILGLTQNEWKGLRTLIATKTDIFFQWLVLATFGPKRIRGIGVQPELTITET